jgi:hypothetical protein
VAVYYDRAFEKFSLYFQRDRERERERETKQYKSTLKEAYVSGTYSELP